MNKDTLVVDSGHEIRAIWLEGGLTGLDIEGRVFSGEVAMTHAAALKAREALDEILAFFGPGGAGYDVSKRTRTYPLDDRPRKPRPDPPQAESGDSCSSEFPWFDSKGNEAMVRCRTRGKHEEHAWWSSKSGSRVTWTDEDLFGLTG